MEMEVRILDVNVDEIRNKLLENSAVLVKKENQINKLFDFENGSLLKQKGYARIRIVQDMVEQKNFYYMTTKRNVSKNDERFKVMDECEIEINDSSIGEKIFKSLGLILNHEIKRYRESYKICNVLVEIDINDKNFYPNPYVEIEGDSKENIENVVKILGYTMEDTTSKNIFDIIKDKNEMR